jgi:hypothetical protein
MIRACDAPNPSARGSGTTALTIAIGFRRPSTKPLLWRRKSRPERSVDSFRPESGRAEQRPRRRWGGFFASRTTAFPGRASDFRIVGP